MHGTSSPLAEMQAHQIMAQTCANNDSADLARSHPLSPTLCRYLRALFLVSEQLTAHNFRSTHDPLCFLHSAILFIMSIKFMSICVFRIRRRFQFQFKFLFSATSSRIRLFVSVTLILIPPARGRGSGEVFFFHVVFAGATKHSKAR